MLERKAYQGSALTNPAIEMTLKREQFVSVTDTQGQTFLRRRQGCPVFNMLTRRELSIKSIFLFSVSKQNGMECPKTMPTILGRMTNTSLRKTCLLQRLLLKLRPG